MNMKNSSTVELPPGMEAYLDEMMKKYDLPDRGKAIRCLINFARERTDLEKEIFEVIRCNDC